VRDGGASDAYLVHHEQRMEPVRDRAFFWSIRLGCPAPAHRTVYSPLPLLPPHRYGAVLTLACQRTSIAAANMKIVHEAALTRTTVESGDSRPSLGPWDLEGDMRRLLAFSCSR
jgi:hypothetical protein